MRIPDPFALENHSLNGFADGRPAPREASDVDRHDCKRRSIDCEGADVRTSA